MDRPPTCAGEAVEIPRQVAAESHTPHYLWCPDCQQTTDHELTCCGDYETYACMTDGCGHQRTARTR